MVVYTSSWGQVTFFTTIESAVRILLDFRGLLFSGGSLVSASEYDSCSEAVIVRKWALCSLFATTSVMLLGQLGAATP